MITQYLFIFIVARLYGPKEQGAFTICFTILQLFAIFSQMGLDNRLTRIIAAHKDQADPTIIKTTYLQSLQLTLFASSIWAIATFLLRLLLLVLFSVNLKLPTSCSRPVWRLYHLLLSDLIALVTGDLKI